jgi:hypothetical protein
MRSNAAFRKLETWQVSMDFVEHCYKATTTFPRDERYGLTSQIRRAAVSVPSNVAEGYCRRKTKVYLQHVRIALGSLNWNPASRSPRDSAFSRATL